MEEKRRNRRIDLKSKLIVKRLDDQQDNGQEIYVDVQNVSRTGIGFESDGLLRMGEVYEAFLTIWTQEVIHAFIEVVRIEKIGEGKYNYGGIFIGMPETDLQRIDVYDVVSSPERYLNK